MLRLMNGVMIALVLLFIAGLVGKMDFEDEARAQIARCEQVKAGELRQYGEKCDKKEIIELKKILRLPLDLNKELGKM